MATAKELLAKVKKQYGDSVVSVGGALAQVERVPTGFFAFDLASGGGFPRGRASIVYGPESSGKTNLVLKAIANHQKLWPDLTCVYVAIEEFHSDWAALLGVDVDRLVVLKPDYAEQAVDMVEGFLHTDDCGVVAVDSLAAMITTAEAEKSAENMTPGGSSVVVGKLVRKSSQALRAAEKAGRSPTLLYVNQTRFKIGVMMGNPETMPGGNAPKFQSAMTVRTYGKNHTDAKVSKTMPVAKETTFVINKWKVPICATHGTYTMVTIPHGGFGAGDCDDFNSVAHFAKQHALLAKGDKQGWVCDGKVFPTLAAVEEAMADDPLWAMGLKSRLMTKVREAGLIDAQAGADD